MAAALAALVVSPALAASHHSRAHGAGDQAAYSAFAAVTPSENNNSAARAAALRECSAQSRAYSESTWGDMQILQERACMAQHGQPE